LSLDEIFTLSLSATSPANITSGEMPSALRPPPGCAFHHPLPGA